MTINLTIGEQEVVKECLLAIASGTFLEDNGGFPTLMGVTFSEAQQVSEAYPEIGEIVSDYQLPINYMGTRTSEEITINTIHGSLAHLLYFSYWSDYRWNRYISVSRKEVERVFKKWDSNLSSVQKAYLE